MSSKSEQTLTTTSPSIEHLLLRDEQRRAAKLKTRKSKDSISRDAEWMKAIASVERFKGMHPVSLITLEEAEKLNPNSRDSNNGDAKEPKSLETQRLEFLTGVDNEVRELRTHLDRFQKTLVATYAVGMMVVSGYIAIKMYEVYQPQPVEEEVYFGIWNLWGAFS